MNTVRVFKNRDGESYCKLPVKLDVVININPCDVDDDDQISENYVMSELDRLNTSDLGDMIVDKLKKQNYHPVYMKSYF